MPPRSKKQQEQEPPATAIPRVFDQVQGSTANHQKNFVALHKVHAQAARQVEPINNGRNVKLVGERAFEDAVLDSLTRVLPVKKGVTVADRVVKFVGGYVKFANEKASAKPEGEEEDEDEETTAARFVNRLLKYLLRGFVAKDKAVRFRCVGLVAEMVSYLGEIDEEVYQDLRAALLDRINDKESPVRVQAVIGLSKLCGSEEPGDVEDNEQTATETLLDLLAHDPAADVRRAALLNVPATLATLPAILARTRDVEGVIRRLVYSAVLLPQATAPSPGAVRGVAHPRALSIAQRELVVRAGLGDRAPDVRKAVARLLGAWVDVAADGAPGADGSVDGAADGDADVVDVQRDVLAFLRMFDLGAATIAEDALLCVFASRPELLDGLNFDEAFWVQALSPEQAFLVRVFAQHCASAHDAKHDARLAAALPDVTDFALRIMNDYHDLRARIDVDTADDDDEADEEAAAREEARMDREFALGELLRIAAGVDYGDELGRRNMFKLTKDMISQPALPESLVPKCLDILRALTPNEKELIRIVVEVVHELRDGQEEEEPAAVDADQTTTSFSTARGGKAARKPVNEMTPEEKVRTDAMDLRCLSLCIAMLERVNSTFEENSTLEGIMQELVVPSVLRKEIQFRERGLHCLGLCCLIARRMAEKFMQLFINQVKSSPELLRIRLLQIIIDLLMTHDKTFLSASNPNAPVFVDFLVQRLETEDSPKVEALICTGLAKLVLARMVTNDQVLRSLVLTFISPHTADNQDLRQCLSYFFPAFCYSTPSNQRRMSKLFVPIFEHVAEACKGADDDDTDQVSPAQLALMFVDWTDPQKAVAVQDQDADPMIHFDLAHDIAKDALLCENKLSKEDKKVLYQLFSKLYLPDDVDEAKVRTLKTLVEQVKSKRPPSETASKNALNKFDASLAKKYEKRLEGFSEEDFLALEECEELKAFLDDIVPLNDDEEEEQPKKRATRKRRSDSVATDASEGTPQPGKRKASGKRSAKRRKVSNSDSESESEASVREVTPQARIVPKRAAAKRQSIVEVEPDNEDEEDDEEDDDGTPVPPARSSRTNTKGKRGAVPEPDDSEEEPQDSIFDSDEE